LALIFALSVGALFAGAFAAAAARPEAVVRHARAVLAALGAVSVFAAAALVVGEPPGLNLRIDPSTEPMLPAGDPAREVYRQAIADFGEDEVYVIAMETEELFRAETLEALRRATDRIARFPEVRSVQSLTDVVSFRYDSELESIEVADFIDEIPEQAEALATLRARALSDPLYRRTLISDDGRTAAINVTFRKMTDQQFIEDRLDERIREALDQEERPGIRFHVAGRSHIKTRVYHVMVGDMRLLIPIALGVVALGLFLVFGSRRGVLLPLGIVAGSTLWTFGAIAWLDRPLTVLTTLLAPMLTAIGSVYGIHALARYEEETARAGGGGGGGGGAEETPVVASPGGFPSPTLLHLRLPVLAAGFTTMIGFGALLLTDVPAVFEVGAFSVLGVASMTLLTLVGFPAALALLPLRAPATAGAAHALPARIAVRLDRLLEAVARRVARHAGIALAVWSVVLAACVVAIPRIEIDTDYLSLFPEEAPIRREFETVNRLLAGAIPLYVALRAEEPGAFREPAALRAVERIQTGAEGAPGVSRTLSVVDTVRVMNRTLAKDDPDEERIPDTRGAVAELLFFAPKGHLDHVINVNHSRANVLVRTGAVGTSAVRELEAKLAGEVARAGLPDGIRADVTGNAILLSRSADGIARSQPRTVALAALAIFALVALAFRSLPLALVAMVPNLVPVTIYFGILGFGAAPLSLPTSLIGSVALGIAIDDTVHYLVRYGRERRAGLSPRAATLVCGRRVGRPIAITSMMLIAGFLVVALSGFATLQQFGLLSAATMAICLLTDLLLLPALLIRTRA
jgi:uncharacterized protein